MNSYSKHFFDDSDDIEIRNGTDSFHSIRIGCCVCVTADDLGQLYRLYSRLDSYLAGTEERDLDENAQADAYENASGHKEVRSLG